MLASAKHSNLCFVCRNDPSQAVGASKNSLTSSSNSELLAFGSERSRRGPVWSIMVFCFPMHGALQDTQRQRIQNHDVIVQWSASLSW